MPRRPLQRLELLPSRDPMPHHWDNKLSHPRSNTEGNRNSEVMPKKIHGAFFPPHAAPHYRRRTKNPQVRASFGGELRIACPHREVNQNRPLHERLRSRDELDFDRLTVQLTGLVGTLSFCDLTFQVGLRTLELVESLCVNYPLPHPLQRRVTYLKGLIAGAQDARNLLERRTQAQVDTVSITVSDELDITLTSRRSTTLLVKSKIELASARTLEWASQLS